MNVEVFGSKLHDAVIHEGILVTTSHTTKIMKLYSFEDILKNNMTEHFNIGDRIEGKGVIGQKPLGFPVNVKLKEEPPVLFSIMCEDFDVTFSEFVPTVCITTDKDYCYKVNNFVFIKNASLVVRINCNYLPFLKVYNIDKTENLSIRRIGYEDENDIVFHPDDSRRLIRLAGPHL